MDRSIKKSISVNELNYIFYLSKVSDEQRSRLIPELFENPQAEKTYLLKEEILTLTDLEDKIRSVIDQPDCIIAIKEGFAVNDDLTIPIGLREKLLGNEKLAFFIGAGVSKLLNIPLWNELADEAINYLKDKHHINQTEASMLKSEKYSAKQVMSIFEQIITDKKEFKSFYKKYLSGTNTETENPYELLFQIEKALAKSIIKISTNIDLEWENVLKNKSEKQQQEQSREGQTTYGQLFYTQTQYSNFNKGQKLEGNVLYQIHGSLHDLGIASITTSQYVNNYREDKGLKGFLEDLFKDYIVLFIGSGMQEFEILEHCLKEQSQTEHYALIGTQMGEDNLFRIKKAYFKDINIKAIPFYLDFQGYNRLLLVLKSWENEIISFKEKQFYDDIKLIDEVL